MRVSGKRYLGRFGPTVLALATACALWWAITTGDLVADFLLPGPIQVLRVLRAELELLSAHAATTIAAAVLGLVIALAVAIVLVVMMGLLPVLRRALYPLLVLSQTVPLVAIAPLFVVWFGFGLLPKVVVVALVCCFPIAISLGDGLQAVDPDAVALFRSMGASRIQRFWLLLFPAGVETLFSGLRIATSYSVMGAVIGEWLGGSSGLGVYMVRAQRSFRVDRVFASIVVVVVLSFGLLLIVGLVEYAARPWKRAR